MTRGPPLPAHRVAIPALPEQPSPTHTRLPAFNTAPPAEAHTTLLSCLHSETWAKRVATHRPYPTLDALLAAADEAAYDLTRADLAEALAAEKMPQLPPGTYVAAHMALSAAHAAYESKFGHAFVIAAETLDHTLEAIRSRLLNDPEDERVLAAEELRKLAKQRLLSAVRGAGNCATSHNGAAPGT
ncbi:MULTISPECIES: 2-oxo-4-hydroxy-4-carboxy-5-ureidoimidazoline decarboxylase [unclassified Streptomyces]|uniref:2-oxo-4-hydroxy-4-carboxy-5-ureidoimidazoline decarboxylase n=1 Tax=unclassified Streptomyces TaxID=2593676 RepID=UPI0013A6B7DA|nr:MULTISPECIES: 2-oxo-4-hydroxy-4-carboxy-5-ureidoimidazoline decarboxylase [unclassified Streptomyces]QZZ32935.1 2-oxo-4-hydroxy-4-carboxy-5-ureidoimidazoline decarboxylase [Streptomyces sp. ST1015]